MCASHKTQHIATGHGLSVEPVAIGEVIEHRERLDQAVRETVVKDANTGVFELWAAGWHEVGSLHSGSPVLPARVLDVPGGSS